MKITAHKKKFDKLIHSRNVLIGVVIFLIIVVFLFILNTVNAGKLNLGTRIGNIPVSRLNSEQAEELLKENFESFLKKDFFLNYKESFWQTNFKKLGIEIDITATLDSSFSKKNILWQIKSLFGYNVKPIWTINQEKLEIFLQKNLFAIHQPAQNATLIYNEEKQDFITTPSKEGIIINKDKLKRELEKNINNFKENDIKLSLIKDKPEVLENETQQAYEKAKELLKTVPIKLFIQEKAIDVINKKMLLELMDFEPENGILGVRFTQEKIKTYLATLAPLINKEPINAELTIKDGKVAAFVLSEYGIELEVQENISHLSEKLLNKENEIELKINKIEPKITTDSINNMGITALLAKGVSNFSGSPSNRMYNIKIGAAKFNGVLIKPDEEFSFNKILGEVGSEQGYLPELVIKKDKTVPEYGGGLCQVSTTVFRAAVNAGLEITQRYAHAFPVKYYNPQGFDATIYPDFPDLKFINNTPNNILIQTKINNYDLIFEIYGTDDNRKVEIDGPYQYNIEEDGSMKAKLFQKVYDKNNQIIIDKIFYSTYKSPDLYPIERNPLE